MSRTTNVQRDEGMTLTELLIAVSLMGLLTTVISAAIVVTFKTHTSADGRLNLAVAEHSVDLWMPTDLASASSVSIDPLVTPCGSTVCAGVDFSTGSTALLLSWTNRVGSAIDDDGDDNGGVSVRAVIDRRRHLQPHPGRMRRRRLHRTRDASRPVGTTQPKTGHRRGILATRCRLR